MKRLAFTLAIVLTLAGVAAACGTNPHPTVTDTITGSNGELCTMGQSHSLEDADPQVVAFILTDSAGCESGTTAGCVNRYVVATGVFEDACYAVTPTNPIVIFSWNRSQYIVRETYTSRNPVGPVAVLRCYYHDPDSSNPTGCHTGVPV